jgi:hypothetical protein
MNKDLELSLLRESLTACTRALRQIRQEAHDAWGTTGAQHSLKKIERTAAHALDYGVRAAVSEDARHE